MSSAADDRQIIKTLHKGLQLLDLVAKANKPLTLTEISHEFQTDAGSVHRFLNTLVKDKYLYQDPQLKTYGLGTKVLSLSRHFFLQHRIYDLARDSMLKLSSHCKETIQLSIISGIPCAVLVDEIVGDQIISVSSSIGMQLPMHCSAHGKILLAMQHPDLQKHLLQKITLDEYTQNTLVKTENLKQELTRCNQRGYAIEDQEFNQGLCAVAAPIYNYNKQVVASIGVSCPHQRFNRRLADELADELCKQALMISEKMGYNPQEFAE
ncbi:MAG: IclR family transcriptional regulator [Planctomycetes bacterium]|nr:IclR family transcriptional regulator [Planctomycetota bacterium]